MNRVAGTPVATARFTGRREDATVVTNRLTDGFDQYFRPDPDRIKQGFQDCLIVLDTNVLLNVLRYTPAARTELLEVLESIAGRCFIPRQVAVEYNRNRVGVVVERQKEFENATSEIEAIRTKVRTVVNSLSHRRMLSTTKIAGLNDAVREFFEALEEAQGEAVENYDLTPDQMAGSKDRWTTRLDEILKGRVADRPAHAELEKDYAEGERRKKEKLAPGFKDDEIGDYLWWAEVLRNPDLKDRPLFVVSDDAAKGDWRFEDRGGYIVGPHEILIDDVAKAGGRDLVLLTTRDLLQLVGSLEPDKVSEATLAESEEVLAARQSTWTFEAHERLLEILEGNGYLDRVEVISTAASQGGFISRADVYAILGVDEESRSLRHFATPVQSAKKILIAEGKVPSIAADALVAEYDGPGKTIGYSTPPEFEHFYRQDALG